MNWFWHKRGVKAILHRYVLYYKPEGANAIGCCHDIVVSEINLMLAGRDLVVRRFHVKPHFLEHEDDLPAYVFAQVNRREVKIPTCIMGVSCWITVKSLKQKKLWLGSCLHFKPELCSHFHNAS